MECTVMYVCVCVSQFKRVNDNCFDLILCINTHTHTHIYIYIYIEKLCVRASVCVCIHMDVCVCVCVCVCVFVVLLSKDLLLDPVSSVAAPSSCAPARAPPSTLFACGDAAKPLAKTCCQTEYSNTTRKGNRTTFCLTNGSGSKLNRRGYAGFGVCFHLPGFHFGTVLANSSMILHELTLGLISPMPPLWILSEVDPTD